MQAQARPGGATPRGATFHERLSAAELAVLLALARAGSLAAAAQQLQVDGSTVFRTVQRVERASGQRLFERSRSGYRATDLGSRLAQHAERIEAELEAARGAAHGANGAVSGLVRISTTDTLLGGLLLPTLPALRAAHPDLRLDLTASNELANLTRRDADIALRATRKPQGHLVGRDLGPIRAAIFAPRASGRVARALRDPLRAPWIAVDESMPDHHSVRWRRRHLPQVVPALLVNSIQSVFDAVAAGVGIGIVPVFLARGRTGVAPISEPLAECETRLWLLTHPESRHLRRIATVSAHLAAAIVLD